MLPFINGIAILLFVIFAGNLIRVQESKMKTKTFIDSVSSLL